MIIKERGITGIEKSKHNKIAVGAIVSICTLLIVYLGTAIYFMNHFYFGSKINGVDVSGKKVEKVKQQMAAELQAYTLKIKERDNKIEEIKGAQIGLKYDTNGHLQELKDKQNAFKWILAFFNEEDLNMTLGVSYDEKLLKGQIDKLSCFDIKNIIKPRNPSLKYGDHNYVVIPEVQGNQINKDLMYNHVSSSIIKQKNVIDLEAMNCYVHPEYTSSSAKVTQTKDLLNKYAASKITYNFSDHKEIIDGSIINKWITIDEKFNITFDEKKAKDYIDVLCKNYNTVGKLRSFVTSSGKTIQISGGDYGWSIDKVKEAKEVIAAIKSGKSIAKEPEYAQTAFSHDNNDIGNTYVEIDMTKQHLWFYKKGILIAQGDVVTGNMSSKHSTPIGIYRLKYKAKNTVLRGADYAAPVTFWMPFNGGVGMHDASWRDTFGGDIYKTNGSHGCINEPYNLAKAIFDNIDVGTPVICYY